MTLKLWVFYGKTVTISVRKILYPVIQNSITSAVNIWINNMYSGDLRRKLIDFKVLNFLTNCFLKTINAIESRAFGDPEFHCICYENLMIKLIQQGFFEFWLINWDFWTKWKWWAEMKYKKKQKYNGDCLRKCKWWVGMNRGSVPYPCGSFW